MPRHKKEPQPAQCPCCGQQVTFKLVVMKISCVDFRQVHAHKWVLADIDPPEFTVTVPAFMICPSCGTPSAAPRSVSDVYRRKAGLPE